MVEKESTHPPKDKEGIPKDKDIYLLLLLYKQFNQVLETFFSGYLIVEDEEINRFFLRLCNKIEDTLKKPGFENLASLDWQPVNNLRSFDPDYPEGDWELGGQQICGYFLSGIEELFIIGGERVCFIKKEDQMLLNQCQMYLEKYRLYKKKQDLLWLQKIDKQAEKWKMKEQITHIKLPQFDFKFINDDELKNLLVKDWEEAKRAYQNDLYKSTVLLCGTVLEALLIDVLSTEETSAKGIYLQKYSKGKSSKDKRSEIQNWQLYQLIEIAKHLKIIGEDAAKLSHIVRDYRNLIHLFVQKRVLLQIDDHVTTVVINLLAIAYKDISEWRKK